MTTRERLKNWYDEQQAASRAEGLKEGVTQGEKQGIQKGRAEGQRTLLAKLLKLKYGKLDASTEERLANATSAQLVKWAERVLTAGSLDEIWA
jgi:flagellar biosynthesis/type III secretory pathway protein FliH